MMHLNVIMSNMAWLHAVGSLKLHVSLAEYRLFYRALLQNRPIILRSLPIEATPYASFICATRLIHIIMPHSMCVAVYCSVCCSVIQCVLVRLHRHVSFICATRLIHFTMPHSMCVAVCCNMCCSVMQCILVHLHRHALFICATYFIHINMPHSHVRHDSFTRATCLIHT